MGDAAGSALRNLLSPPRLADGQTRMLLGHDGADTGLGGGLMKGALHEVFAADSSHGGAASGFAAGLALRVGANKKLLWIQQDFSALEFGELSATGFVELGLDPDRVILVRAADATGVLRAARRKFSISSPAAGSALPPRAKASPRCWSGSPPSPKRAPPKHAGSSAPRDPRMTKIGARPSSRPNLFATGTETREIG